MSKPLNEIFDFTKTSDDCVKCGKCIPVCTIHNVNADEVTSPRGFIDLLGAYKRGKLELDKTAKDIFESCFLCTNCTDVCPKSLPTDMVIEQVRADIAKKYGIAWYKRAFFLLLRHRWLNDLYLTQGPYFTTKFNELKDKHKNFEVIQTGWCKLDNLYDISNDTKTFKQELLKKYDVKHIVLYAPTFSPSLTSGEKLVEVIKNLSDLEDILVIIKFHDKMDVNIVELYKTIITKNLFISDAKDITQLLQISDLMISDTSSVVYEFILLNKPVVTLNSTSQNINWLDVQNGKDVEKSVLNILAGNDIFKEKRQSTIDEYHPYNDGQSASRMVDAVIKYKNDFGVPSKRKISFFRKLKIYKQYRS